MKLLQLVRRGTSYSTLLSMVLMKLALHREDCHVKFKTMLSMPPKEKSLHTIESSKDLEVAFDEYVNWHGTHYHNLCGEGR